MLRYMNFHLTCIMILSSLAIHGCSSGTNSSPSVSKPTVKIKPLVGSQELTPAKLDQLAADLNWSLPDDYRKFMLEQNGGFPIPDCVTFEETGHNTCTDVYCFHALGEAPPYASVEWHATTFAPRIPRDTLPIARDSCGNLWLLCVGSANNGAVYFGDHGTFDTFDETDLSKWPRVAASFTEFLDALGEFKRLPEEDALLSRYALVQKAFQGMAKEGDVLDKHALADAAWHCHVDDNGLKMQAVDYVTHAVATHTDGYSKLRADAGLIQAGPPRLP